MLLLGSVPTLGPRGSGAWAFIPLGPWAEVLRDRQDFSQAEMKVKHFPEEGNHRGHNHESVRALAWSQELHVSFIPCWSSSGQPIQWQVPTQEFSVTSEKVLQGKSGG